MQKEWQTGDEVNDWEIILREKTVFSEVKHVRKKNLVRDKMVKDGQINGQILWDGDEVIDRVFWACGTLFELGLAFDSKMTFEKLCSVSRAASQLLGILRKSIAYYSCFNSI